MSKGSAIISILIAFVGGLLIGNLTSSGGGDEEIAAEGSSGRVGAAVDDDTDRVRVDWANDRPWKGAENALITIVEISDFECPFCSRVGPTLSQIMNEYEGKVRIQWRNNPLPFHQNAPLAHRAAMEVYEQGGNDKFWAYHDLLFQNQRELNRDNLERWAQQVGGIDMGQFRQALDGEEHQSAITEDQAIATRIDARGTPHFVINGVKIAGAQPFERFKEIIDAQLTVAEGIREREGDDVDVYATLMQNAQENAGAAPAAAEGQPARPQPDPNAVYRVPVGNEPSKGPADALVTVVEFSDFECPFCSRVNPTISQLLQDYGRDIRIVWMNNPLPFHQNAGPAAQAALEIYEQAGAQKFWAFHDKLFENQRALTRENLEQYAQEIGGVNMTQLRAALDNNEHQATITAQQTLARNLGATGTPSFFINGRNLRGAQPVEAFKSVIDEELAKARRLVQSGTPRARVYAATIADGATQQVLLDAPAPAAAPAAAPTPPPDQVYRIPDARDAPSKGPARADVTIQIFSDFQCPFCSRVNPTIQQIVQEYPRQVRLVWRHFPLPFHQDAPLAHQASIEVHRQGGDAKFWAYHDLLFQNQRALARADLERYAEQVGGINMAQFRQALDTNRHQARVQQDIDAVNNAGARIGTPSFFINGRLIQGAQPFEAFKTAIDRAIAE